jgi:hypothetical protein
LPQPAQHGAKPKKATKLKNERNKKKQKNEKMGLAIWGSSGHAWRRRTPEVSNNAHVATTLRNRRLQAQPKKTLPARAGQIR